MSFRVVDVPGKGKRWYNPETKEFRTHLQGANTPIYKDGQYVGETKPEDLGIIGRLQNTLQGAPAGGFGSASDMAQFDPRNVAAGLKQTAVNQMGGLGGLVPGTQTQSAYPGQSAAPYTPPAADPKPPVDPRADRAYQEEASRLAQQKDPYMQAAGMYVPDVEAAFGKPMPERDYADEKDGLMGILNQMETENLQGMGYGPQPGLTNIGQSVAGGAAATNMTQAAESAEAAGNLQPPSPVSANYTGYPGNLNVAQTFGEAMTLDGADEIYAMLEQSRNNPKRDFRGNSPYLGE